MKKNYLWVAAMASLLSMTACSDDASSIEIPEVPGEVVMEEGNTIEIAISNTGIGSRAARPMGSSAAANNVNKVQLKFYSSKDGASWEAANSVKVAAVNGENSGFTGNVIDFSETSKEGVPGSTDRIEESKKVKLNGLEPSTQYRIVAYGYNGEQFPYTDIADDKGLHTTKNTNNLSEYKLEEVFAGTINKTTNASAKFATSPKVTMERQVAGILAYFKVPTRVANNKGELKVVKTVKVIANDKSEGFKFPAKMLTNSVFNGIDFEELQDNKNNDTEAENDVLMTFEMSKAENWNAGNPAETDEYYKVKNSKTATGIATGYVVPTGLKLIDDAFFGARYVLPYDQHVASNTLTVELWGGEAGVEAGNEKLKSLIVTTNQIPSDGTKQAYDIRCNNFYSIGKKMATGNTGGAPDPNPDPDKPTPDPDKPIDLGATDQIVVEINDAWDILHDMGVEEE